MGAKPTPAPFPNDSRAALELIRIAQQESQTAFSHLFPKPQADGSGRELYRQYREKTARLLEVLRQSNESPLRLPQPWDLTIIAQPLVQQTLIEADLVHALGGQAESEELRKWAVETAREYLPRLAFARIRRSMATQWALAGRFNEALVELEDVAKLFSDAGDIIQSTQTAVEEVTLLDWLGDGDRGLRTLDAVRPRVDAETGATADVQGQHSTVDEGLLEQMGFQPGVPWFERLAQAMARERQSIAAGHGSTGEADRLASTWRVSVEIIERAARIYKSRAEYDRAAALWESVLPHYESLGGGTAIDYQLVSIDCARGRYAEAAERLKRIQSALADFARGFGMIAGVRLLESMVSLGLNKPADALRLAEEGIANLESHPDDDLAWRLHWRKAQALRAMNHDAEALEIYARGAAYVDSLRKAPLGYRLDSTAIRAKLPLFEEAIALAADRGDAAACLRFIELIKARGLSSALSIPAQRREQRTELELEFDQITQRLDALEYQGYTGAGRGQAAWKERGSLLNRRVELIEQIRLRDPRWRGLTAPAPFDAAMIAASLKKRKQAALTLHLHNGVVFSVLVIDGRVEVAQQRLNADVLEKLNSYAANLIQPDVSSGLEAVDPARLKLDATTFVPADLLEKALSASSLVIAPHGQLHVLPWASLPLGEQRLFEATAVGMIPNLTCALALDYQPAHAPRAAIAAVSRYPGLSEIPDLPGTGAELQGLKALYEGRLLAPPLIDEAASESGVRALATRADAGSSIFHLACHGVFSIVDPLGSGVLLSDGKIDAAEWAQMRLQYDEVVLSACSTGWRPQTARGIPLHGDDVLGLPGALLEAGARSIVVSIPKAVDRATETFMMEYHRHRAAGAPPLQAFCRTQRKLLASDLKPYTWSGLVCYGVR